MVMNLEKKFQVPTISVRFKMAHLHLKLQGPQKTIVFHTFSSG
jgi:hypothetical protein